LSCLLFSIIENKPIHVVLSFDETNKKVYIITVYEPTMDEFLEDFKTRRRI